MRDKKRTVSQTELKYIKFVDMHGKDIPGDYTLKRMRYLKDSRTVVKCLFDPNKVLVPSCQWMVEYETEKMGIISVLAVEEVSKIVTDTRVSPNLHYVNCYCKRVMGFTKNDPDKVSYGKYAYTMSEMRRAWRVMSTHLSPRAAVRDVCVALGTPYQTDRCANLIKFLHEGGHIKLEETSSGRRKSRAYRVNVPLVSGKLRSIEEGDLVVVPTIKKVTAQDVKNYRDRTLAEF